MDLIEASDGDAACPRARKNGTELAHADREYFGHLAFGGPRVFDWRRGAVFQTWHYSSVCPAPEDKMGRKMKDFSIKLKYQQNPKKQSCYDRTCIS